MSLPKLRQPKTHVPGKEKRGQIQKNDEQFIILTLNNSVKLVVTSDSFHCIRNVEYSFICVLCNINIGPDVKLKENHKNLPEHQRLLKVHPYLEELVENLIRQMDNSNCYCTICSIVTPVHSITQHVQSDEHKHELGRAILRADSYKPCVAIDLNNNK